MQVPRPDRDLAGTAAGAVTFNTALGIATVALPLLALETGYSKAAIGFLTAASAAAQTCVRMCLGAVMRRCSDWVLIFSAGGLLAASCAIVAGRQGLAPFVAAEVLQGTARGCFWTGTQTHAVRGPGPSVRRLAFVNLLASGGLFVGPVLAGFLAQQSLPLALAIASLVALVGMLPPLGVDRFPAFAPSPQARSDVIWRRAGVDTSCWAVLAAGAWRGLIGSYVPVALAHARQSSATIGVLISVANAASVAGATLVARVRSQETGRILAVGTVAAGCGTALVALAASWPPWAAVVLAIGGLGAGILQTLAPAAAADAVAPQERGKAIAATGTFRAAALLLSPLAVAGMLTIAPLSSAMAAIGGLTTVPALFASRRRRPWSTDAKGDQRYDKRRRHTRHGDFP